MGSCRTRRLYCVLVSSLSAIISHDSLLWRDLQARARAWTAAASSRRPRRLQPPLSLPRYQWVTRRRCHNNMLGQQFCSHPRLGLPGADVRYANDCGGLGPSGRTFPRMPPLHTVVLPKHPQTYNSAWPSLTPAAACITLGATAPAAAAPCRPGPPWTASCSPSCACCRGTCVRRGDPAAWGPGSPVNAPSSRRYLDHQ